MAATTLFQKSIVLTMAEHAHPAVAIAIRDGRVAAVGTEAEAEETAGRDADFAHQTVDLADEFGSKTAVVLKPATFCTPVDENGGGIKDPSAHLACYRIKDRGARPAPEAGAIHNQFGDESLTGARSLCVPSTLP